MEIELFDGTVLEFPAGTSQDVIDRVARTETLARRSPQPTAAQPPAPPKRSFGAALKDNFVGVDDGVTSYGESLGTFLNRAGESMTLGVVGDEASAAVGAPIKRAMGNADATYESELARYRQNEKNMSGAGRLSADLFGALAPAALGVGLISSAPTVGRAMARGAGLGAGAGAVQGFAEGEGGLQNRADAGFVGGLIGGTLGGAIPGVGAAGGQIYRSAQGAARNSKVGRQVGEALGVAPETGRVLGRVIGEQDPATMRSALNRAGPSGMLADASPGAEGSLDAAMRSPTPGAALARGRVDARAQASSEGVLNALDGGRFGPQIPPVANQAARSASARPTINPLYERAYNTPINYATPEGQAVESIIRRAPIGIVQRAINSANDAMRYDQLPTQQIMASIDDSGAVTLSEMPNTMMADYIKRAFDSVAEDSKDAITGRMSADGAFANRIARDLRGAIADAVPAYDEALAAASTDIRSRAAVRTGQTLLNSNTTIEDMATAIADATPAELRAMRQGVRSQIDHVMGNVRAVASDQNVDARAAAKLFSDISSPNSKLKLQALFADDFPALSQQLQEAGAALGLRARVSAGSQTQPRLAADQVIKDEVTPGAIRGLQPIESVRDVGRRALGSDDASVARLSDDVRGQLADVLSRPGGAGLLDEVIRNLSANPLPANTGQGVNAGLLGAGLTSLPTMTERTRGLLQGPRQ
jgi:hypothetical protein|tara:strand:+ start:19753 stop:21870 length:2118 start_codon:yes stop_codon:yes gene_type:complete